MNCSSSPKPTQSAPHVGPRTSSSDFFSSSSRSPAPPRSSQLRDSPISPYPPQFSPRFSSSQSECVAPNSPPPSPPPWSPPFHSPTPPCPWLAWYNFPSSGSAASIFSICCSFSRPAPFSPTSSPHPTPPLPLPPPYP